MKREAKLLLPNGSNGSVVLHYYQRFLSLDEGRSVP
jgi:hypothetical protein